MEVYVIMTGINKALPFDVVNGWTAVPRAVLRHYQYLPQFNGATTAVYSVLLSHYNKAYGYAYPKHSQIALTINMTEKTVGKHIKTLESAGLVNVIKNGRFGNDQYTFNVPIEDADEFFAKFPEAGERYRKVRDTIARNEAAKGERMARMVAQDETTIEASFDEDILDWL